MSMSYMTQFRINSGKINILGRSTMKPGLCLWNWNLRPDVDRWTLQLYNLSTSLHFLMRQLQCNLFFKWDNLAGSSLGGGQNLIHCWRTEECDCQVSSRITCPGGQQERADINYLLSQHLFPKHFDNFFLKKISICILKIYISRDFLQVHLKENCPE